MKKDFPNYSNDPSEYFEGKRKQSVREGKPLGAIKATFERNVSELANKHADGLFDAVDALHGKKKISEVNPVDVVTSALLTIPFMIGGTIDAGASALKAVENAAKKK